MSTSTVSVDTVSTKKLKKGSSSTFLFVLASVVAVLLSTIFAVDYAGKHSLDVSILTKNPHVSADVLAGIFAFGACLISLHQVYQHRRVFYSHPPSQKYAIRVLLMVPIYAVTAFLGIVFLEYNSYFDFIRTCYEAYTIYCFLMLLTKYVGGHSGVCDAMLDHAPYQHWPAPMNWIKGEQHIEVTPLFVTRLKQATLQYSFVAPIIALIIILAEEAHIYEEGVFAFDNVYVYTTIILNVSQMVALYCLLWLYHGIDATITVHSPLAKFLSVKAIVFASFWQSVIIAGLVHFHVIHDNKELTTGQIQLGLQDLLICIEMFIAAGVHHLVFPVQPYASGKIVEMLKESTPKPRDWTKSVKGKKDE